ncbi:MAG: T9SS type A sorting domain-containing protein [Bacteroidales bacterium]|nr:T9SS type A sorting domain-containing protein [Bacteroidales bacterium]
MKRAIILIGFLITFESISWAQCRFVDPVIKETQSLQEIPYSSAIPVGSTSPKTLYFDFYEPAEDTMQNRPLVITVFGGAFIAGNRQWPDMIAYAESLTKYGYTVASIDYRLLPLLQLGATNFIRSAYMAIQDVSAAVRYFKGNAATYKIDTNQIFLLGNSAGTIASLNTLYFNDYNRPLETYADEAEDLLDLGGVHTSGDPQYLSYSPKVAGVIAQWGCILDTNTITPQTTTPVCLIHGTADKSIPYTSGIPYEETLGETVTSIFPIVYGSYYIDKMLTKYNIEHELHPFEGEEHAFYIEGFSKLLPDKFDTCLKVTLDFLAKHNTHINCENAIKENNLAEITLHPNPAHDFLHVTLSEQAPYFSYVVRDMLGREIIKGENDREINISTLNKGVYIIEFHTANQKMTKKIIKY